MDMILEEMFSSELILPDIKAQSWQEILEKAGDYLFEKGYVKDSFKDALIQREYKYPTGLPTNGVRVALPHTDVVHVKKPGILFMNLDQPVAFKEMGNGERDVMVEMVFVIAVHHTEKEVEVLRSLMAFFTDEDSLKRLKACGEKSEMCDFFDKFLKSKV